MRTLFIMSILLISRSAFAATNTYTSITNVYWANAGNVTTADGVDYYSININDSGSNFYFTGEKGGKAKAAMCYAYANNMKSSGATTTTLTVEYGIGTYPIGLLVTRCSCSGDNCRSAKKINKLSDRN